MQRSFLSYKHYFCSSYNTKACAQPLNSVRVLLLPNGGQVANFFTNILTITCGDVTFDEL